MCDRAISEGRYTAVARDDEFCSKLVKIVYFDEESASDLLDIVAGGKETTANEQTRERAADVQAKVEAKAAAKFSWLPFLGGSLEANSAAGASAVGRSIFNKTLSNTILTDYLSKFEDMSGVELLQGVTLTATKDSAAYMKMFTPYLAMLKVAELPVDFAALDSAMESAKGYYELIGTDLQGQRSILRFNIRAFRNNYGLADLGKMRLVFHGVQVGEATESSLTMWAEMQEERQTAPLTGLDIVEATDPDPVRLMVYDVLLAGVSNG